MTQARAVTTRDGRTLAVLDAGAPDGAVLVAHHGTPGAGGLFRSELESAERLGLRPGHITLFVNRVGDVHAWLCDRLV
jgi:pimeloyl-ACP methyl ester carboxylesterase